MERYAAKLGSDCAFFITAEPSYATGRGEILEPADGPKGNLHGYSIVVVKPDVAVSTRDAYAQIVCHMPRKSCRDIVRQPISTWRDELTNDFEGPVFKAHPELARIKQSLYDMGALYAQMRASSVRYRKAWRISSKVALWRLLRYRQNDVYQKKRFLIHRFGF